MAFAPGTPNEGPGRVIAGRYRMVRLLGRGGMGVVYEVEHLVTLKHVALKILHPAIADLPGFRDRFVREARARSGIGHEGIVDVLDAGEDEDGTLFLAMELLEGESLRDYARRPDTTRLDALVRVLELCDPLAAAHARGYVHRDLKPENVFVLVDGPRGVRVKLLDFGIARDARTDAITRTGSFLGTLKYVSPEQARSPQTAGPTADVWSLGVMVYELLTGRMPFGNGDVLAVQRSAVERHEPLRSIDPSLPESVEAFVDRCLAKAVEDRPANAGAAKEILSKLLADEATRARLRTLVPLPAPPAPPSAVRATARLDGQGPEARAGAPTALTAPLRDSDVSLVAGHVEATEILGVPEAAADEPTTSVRDAETEVRDRTVSDASNEATLLLSEPTETTAPHRPAAVAPSAGSDAVEPSVSERSGAFGRRARVFYGLAAAAIALGLFVGWLVGRDGEPRARVVGVGKVRELPAAEEESEALPPVDAVESQGVAPSEEAAEPPDELAVDPPDEGEPAIRASGRASRRGSHSREAPDARTSGMQVGEVRYGSNRAPIVH